MSRSHQKCSKRPFYYDCECETSVNLLDMLIAAMKDEKEAYRYYKNLAKKAQCEADKELFKHISMEEKRHYGLLQEIYRDLTCECYCIKKYEDKKPKGFCRAIKAAICEEMQGISDYENLACHLCDMCHKEVICAIINDERKHAHELAALYQFCQECACKSKQPKASKCNCTCTCTCHPQMPPQQPNQGCKCHC